VVTSRILTRRRIESPPLGRVGYRARPALVQMAASAGGRGRRLPAHSRIYMVGVAIAVLTVANLLLSAQTTQTSYELGHLRDHLSQLQAEQGQLRYQQAAQHTPAEIEVQAHQQGMVRPMPAGYLVPQPLGFSLEAPLSSQPESQSPWGLVTAVVDGWLRAGGLPREPA
jgi:hypothetical protein